MSLNTASAEHYARSKDLPVKGLRFEGSGVRTLVTQLLEFVRDRSFQTAYLDDLFVEYDGVDEDAQLLRRTPYRWPPAVAPPMQRGRARAYAAAGDRDKTAMMQAEFDSRDRSDIYATSPDFNLRELGIEFIGEHLGEGRVLELGCGNGHALISLARATQAEMVGIDLSASMIEGARARAKQLESDLTGTLSFQQGDIRSLPFDADTFDYVISQGAIVTLPSRADQWQTIREIHRVLVDGGAYIMVEGTEDGFGRLNRVREAVGLPPFPSVSDENFSSLKFDEGELHGFLAEMFATEEVRYFGAYYLISRVLHPLLALPQPPRFAASINRKAREIDQIARDCGKLGHLVGYKLIARKGVSATSDVPNRQYEVAR
jgi:SAM-dependent methyltransferase